MRQILLIFSLLGLCQIAKCGDSSLEQLKHSLPYGFIPGTVPLGATRSLGCTLAPDYASPQEVSPEYKKRGAIFIFIHATENSALGGGCYIEIRGTVMLKPNTDYRIKGYESGEFVKDATDQAATVDSVLRYLVPDKDATDQAATAEPALRYHSFFVVMEAVETGRRLPGT